MTSWILSTEPKVYPWTKVRDAGTARWDGIRGPLARKNLRTMRKGDRIVGYHGSPEKALVCLARAASEPYPDPADPAWLAVDVCYETALPRPVPLAELRAVPELADMPFLRIPRLSVAPVTDTQWLKILTMAKESSHA